MSSGSSQKILWAPWRMEYILGEKESECIFCTKPAEKDDRKNLILWRGEDSFVIMNRYPYNNGHLMVVPYRHTADFESLQGNESQEMFAVISKSIEIIKKTILPEGFNIGMNIGKVGGAGIAEHLHFHIVPRWGADTNFMPVVGHTKVISEGLWETWDRFKGEFDRFRSIT